MSDPKISIVTVCLNARKTIGEAIASIHNQTYQSIEHIVVDGLSTDGTLEILRERQTRIATLLSEPDDGLYFAMNKGIALATGDYLGFLNADDIYADDKVLDRVAHALQSGNFDAAYGDLVYVKQSNPKVVTRYWKSRPYEAGLIEQGWMPAHPTFFVRTKLLQKLGGFDTRYRYQSDYELVIRLFLKECISAIYVPEILVRMRTGGHSNRSLRNVVKGNLEAYRACLDNDIRVSPLFVLRKLISRIPQLFLHSPQQASRPKAR